MLRVTDHFETILLVQTMCVMRDEHPAAQSLQFRVIDHTLDQPLPQSLLTITLYDKDVCQISESGVIGDDASKADLLFQVVKPEAQ